MKVIDCFKIQSHSKHILYLHPFVLMVALDMIIFVNANGYSTLITSLIRTPEESRKLMSVSTTHETARAFDLRVRGWTKDFTYEFVDYFSRKYKGHGATNLKGEEKLIVIHGEGENLHAHIQFNRDYGDPMAWLKI